MATPITDKIMPVCLVLALEQAEQLLEVSQADELHTLFHKSLREMPRTPLLGPGIRESEVKAQS